MSFETRKSDTHEERYYHIPIDGHPKVHMATVFVREDTPGKWSAAVAFCAHGDTFSRRIGRQTARRRYFRWRAGEASQFTGWFADGVEPNYARAELVAQRAASRVSL